MRDIHGMSVRGVVLRGTPEVIVRDDRVFLFGPDGYNEVSAFFEESSNG